MQTAFEHNTNTFGQTAETVFTVNTILYRGQEEVRLYSGGFSSPSALMGKDKKLKEPFDIDGVQFNMPNFFLCEKEDIMTGKVALLRLRDEEVLDFHILDKPVINSNGKKSVHPQWNKTHNGKEEVVNTDEFAECHMTVNRGDELTVTYTTKMLKVVWNITSLPPKQDSRDASPEPEFEEDMSPEPEFQESQSEGVQVKKEKKEDYITVSDDEHPSVKNPEKNSSRDEGKTIDVNSEKMKDNSSDEDETPLKAMTQKKRHGSAPRKALSTKKSKKEEKKSRNGELILTHDFTYKLGQAKPNQPMSQYIAFITDPTKKEIVDDMVNYCQEQVKNPKNQRSFSASMNSLMQTGVGRFIKEHKLDYKDKIAEHNSKIDNITEADDKTTEADSKEKEEAEAKTADPKEKEEAETKTADPKEKEEAETKTADPKEKGPTDEKPKKRKRLQPLQLDSDDEDEDEVVDIHTFKIKADGYTTSSTSINEKDLKGYALKGTQITQDK